MTLPTAERTIRPPKPIVRFGPADHGRKVTVRQTETAEYVPGFKYELIDGKLYVSPVPSMPENWLENWLFRALIAYTLDHPEVINWVTPKGKIVVADADAATEPEPDFAAYHDFPIVNPPEVFRWQDFSPVLVCEILVGGDIEKDLGRNPPLYFRVPSIREYWVVNGAEDWRRPSIIQHVRRGKRWTVTTHPFASTFTTKLLPTFSLVVDPSRR